MTLANPNTLLSLTLLIGYYLFWIGFFYARYDPQWRQHPILLSLMVAVPCILVVQIGFVCLESHNGTWLRFIYGMLLYGTIALTWSIGVWWFYRHMLNLVYHSYKLPVENDIVREAGMTDSKIKWLGWSVYQRTLGAKGLVESHGRRSISAEGIAESHRRIAALFELVSFPEHWYHHLMQLVFLGLCWPISLGELLVWQNPHQVSRRIRRFFQKPHVSGSVRHLQTCA